MSTCHYRVVPSVGSYADEPILYRCNESPCAQNGVTIPAMGMDTHATLFHNADHVEILSES